MSEIMPIKWRSVKLASVVSRVISGGTPTSGNPRYYQQSGLPFVKIDDMTRSVGRYVDSTTLRITPAALRESATRLLPTGTILISMYGTIGLTKILNRPMASNQAISALVPPFNCDAGYLYHAINHLRPRLKQAVSQTTQPSISGRIIKEFMIQVPEDGSEQRKIAEILDTVDCAIRSTERTIAKLDVVHGEMIASQLDNAHELVHLTEVAKITVGYVGPTAEFYTSEDRGIPFFMTG
jgi:type I restriction enzyme, S subunit